MVKFYKVGGCVRDELLGRKCKDIDYSVEAPSFDAMREEILDRGGEIFVENPEFLTIRAKVFGMGACDFVLCRKDGVYYDGRHPESVEPGTIYDDLARRDFTMNAIAKCGPGQYLDPHKGMLDISNKLIKCVGNPHERFNEDALRLLRALRFAIVLGFDLDAGVHDCLRNPDYTDALMFVSIERIREEMLKAFKHDTLATLRLLGQYPKLEEIVFSGSLWLMPTLRS